MVAARHVFSFLVTGRGGVIGRNGGSRHDRFPLVEPGDEPNHTSLGGPLERGHGSLDYPFGQVRPIAGLLAFYNEKLDIIVDGVQLSRPRTHFTQWPPNVVRLVGGSVRPWTQCMRSPGSA